MKHHLIVVVFTVAVILMFERQEGRLRMANSSAARAEARFKQLCCLGLGGEAVMPALLNELRAVIPSFGSNVFLANAAGQLDSMYDENPEAPEIGQLYFENFHDRPEAMGPSFAVTMRTHVGVNVLEDVVNTDLQTFHRSEFYNLIFRLLGYDPFMRLTVRERGRRMGLGSLTLYRSAGEPPFSQEDRRRLGALETFVAHALTEGGNQDLALVDSGASGLIVASPEGKPIYFSREGLRLLSLATTTRYNEGRGVYRVTELPRPLIELCRGLRQVFSDDVAALAPVYHHRNGWGGFVFRAHWLEGNEPASGLIGIAVTHQEPMQVKLIRNVARLPLSRRQAEVCFLMASGASNEKIAERLGISKSTAISHGRWI